MNGLSIDTRTLKEGDLFVALQGDNRDGHDFVAAAFDAKAGAALVTHAPVGVSGPLLTVAHAQRGLERLLADLVQQRNQIQRRTKWARI